MSDFIETVTSGRPVLTDGGIETRIMFETPIHMDPDVQVAALLDHRDGRMKLESVYSGYVEAAREFSLPVVIGTPTFRAGPNFIRRAGLPEEDIGRLNRQAAGFLKDVREKGGHEPVFIGGVIGPSGDAYMPGQALPVAQAAEYHRPQAEALAVAGVDFLFAPTFPSVDEAEGACIAMARTGVPHVISFILGPEGDVLDGTPLAAAINRIDDNPDARPLYFSLSCIHALAAAEAVAKLKADSAPAYGRLAEFKANGSPLRTDRLVQLDHPETDDPETFAAEMAGLFDPAGLHVLGGCCGTDDSHIRALARLLADQGPD